MSIERWAGVSYSTNCQCRLTLVLVSFMALSSFLYIIQELPFEGGRFVGVEITNLTG